jgi:cytochrome c553
MFVPWRCFIASTSNTHNKIGHEKTEGKQSISDDSSSFPNERAAACVGHHEHGGISIVDQLTTLRPEDNIAEEYITNQLKAI